MLRHDPEGFRRDFKADFLAVAAVESGRPTMIDFHPVKGNHVGIESKVYPNSGAPVHEGDLGLSVMGERSAIDRDYPNEKLAAALRRVGKLAECAARQAARGGSSGQENR